MIGAKSSLFLTIFHFFPPLRLLCPLGLWAFRRPGGLDLVYRMAREPAAFGFVFLGATYLAFLCRKGMCMEFGVGGALVVFLLFF